MAKRGRPQKGANLVDKLEGSISAKARLKVIMQSVSGELSVGEACKQLGIGRTAFHQLREQALSSALEGLEPRKTGRPPTGEPAQSEQELKVQLFNIRKELEASMLREELALLMPHVLASNQTKKKPREIRSIRKKHGKRK